MKRFLQAMQRTGETMLRYQYQRSMFLDAIFSRRDYDNLVKDTAREVITNLNATADVSEIFDAIDDLEKRLNKLGK